MTIPTELSAERLADSINCAMLHIKYERGPDGDHDLASTLEDLLTHITTLNLHIAELTTALQPFSAACVKADTSSEEARSLGGRGHSDDATPGWGIRYKHLKAARAMLCRL